MKRLFIIITVFILLMTSCGSDVSETSNEPVTETLTLSATEGKADFVFIYREGADQDIEEALNSLRKFMCEKESIDRIDIYDDTRKENKNIVEILVGDTNRKASQNIVSKLRDREFTISVSEGKFIIAGYDDEATVDAINHFYMHYDDMVSEGELSVKRNYTLKYDYKYDNIKVGNTDISAYTIVYPDPGGVYSEKHSNEKYAAQRLSQQISLLCGISLPTANEKDCSAEHRFVIKKAEDTEGYSIRTEGSTVIISAGSIYGYTKAFDALLENKDISGDFNCEGNSEIKEYSSDEFVYVDYITDTVYGDSPVKSIKIGDTDITEYRIVYHDYGKGYSGYAMNEIYAAQQLQRYIRYALGTELVLVSDSEAAAEHEILVGNTTRTSVKTEDFGNEEYIIKAEDGNLIITGGEQRGTLYGVYSFLEDHIGCRFFTEDCEIIYKAESITIPADLDKHFVPDLEYRDIDEKEARSGEGAAKRKINSSFCRAMTYSQGSSVDFAGGAFVHTMSTVYDLGLESRQPCFSSEENYLKVLEKTRKILKSNPNAEIISVTQNDNNNHCTCKECSLIFKEEESHAGPMLRFVNRLAEELEDEYPNIKIQTLAYMFSTEAPKITVPHKNVIVELCSLDMCCAHPLSDLSCTTNEAFRRQIEDWSIITDNLYIWYYVVEFTGNSRNAPFMNFDALYDTYTLFRQCGVKGIFNQAFVNDDSYEFGALRAYVLSKLMWDPDMTRDEFDRAIHEFIRAYYGEASDVIEEYFYMMGEFARNRHFEQYCALSGILDINRFNLAAPELETWMDSLGSMDYARSETKTHVNRLRKGFKMANSYAKNMK